jgi:hypothetical protein
MSTFWYDKFSLLLPEQEGEKQYVKLFRMKPIILKDTALDMKMIVTQLIHRILCSIQDCSLFHTISTPERPV